MAKRRKADKAYVAPEEAVKLPAEVAPSMLKIAMRVPTVVQSFATSAIKQNEDHPDWSLYRVIFKNNVPYIVREMCDRCGKVKVGPRFRKLREYNDKELGTIYLETGICKDCINASVYVDQYLDGEVLTEKEAKNLFYKYAEEYEKAWRVVLAAAPNTAMTEAEWTKACEFFGGCAVCGGPIEARVKYFPIALNGMYTAWNVIPMCNSCIARHYAGRKDVTKKIQRYRVFSSRFFFNKSKTIRLYLLRQMELHGVYMMPLQQYRDRFKENKILEGSG